MSRVDLEGPLVTSNRLLCQIGLGLSICQGDMGLGDIWWEANQGLSTYYGFRMLAQFKLSLGQV